jgi:hypothetical protein
VERQGLLVKFGRLDGAGGALEAEADEGLWGDRPGAEGAVAAEHVVVVVGQRRLAAPVAVEGQRQAGAEHGAEALGMTGALLAQVGRLVRIDPEQAKDRAPRDQRPAEAAEVPGGEIRIAAAGHGLYMGRMTFLRTATFAFAFSLVAGAAAAPALATSCDTHTINARSVDETAQAIWEESDILGFGFVRELPGAPALQQQEVEIFAALKGEAEVVRLAPERVNRVGRVDGMIRWFHAKPEEVRLFALVRTPQGAATHVCEMANIESKPASELYPALVRLALARGSAGR